MLIASATILSLIQIIKLPFGGAVTLASMVPIIISGYIYGLKWGLFTGMIYGILQLITGINTVSAFFLPGDSKMLLPCAISICIIDYILAFTVLGLGGIFKNKLGSKTKEICTGALVATLLRYILHVISGVIFFGSWASWFFGDSTGLSQIAMLKPFCLWITQTASPQIMSLVYSVIYNGCYMIPEIIITVVAALAVSRIPLIKIQSKNAE